jgi:hypothetical protein
MGIVKKGSLLDGVTGRVGDLVLRVQGEKTIVSHRPRGQKSKKPTTETRQKTLTRFQSAVAFAREARHRHAYRSLSRLLGRYSPYHVALQDFLSEPTIEEVDDSEVRLDGGTLTVRVGETVAIRSVRVKMPAIEEIDPDLRPTDPAGKLLTPSPTQENQPKARLPIPAALFFSRPAVPNREVRGDSGGELGRESGRESGGGSGCELGRESGRESGDRAPSAAVLDALPSGRFIGNAQREERVPAQRPKGVPDDVEMPTEMRIETWKARLPRAGEVEIIASDYAGNQASQRVWVGPRF